MTYSSIECRIARARTGSVHGVRKYSTQNCSKLLKIAQLCLDVFAWALICMNLSYDVSQVAVGSSEVTFPHKIIAINYDRAYRRPLAFPYI